ncbi:MAG: hypothetical protein WCJ58_04025 [bacterium]
MQVIRKGTNPKLGLFSGIHGDEWRIISSVKKAVDKYSDQLSSYLYIPECSPSAVKSKTRENLNGVDLNRCFIKQPIIDEAVEITNILKLDKFDLCVDFHEDVEPSENAGVYVYDSDNIEGSDILTTFRNKVVTIAPLFTGIDDSSDNDLGRMSNKGYRPALPPEKDMDGNFIYEGFLDFWALIEGITKRWITLEVPTNLTQQQKDSVVEIFIKTLILEEI